ncbi:MAG TPA: hypothetical protein VGK96_25420 [Candidatus Sulfotelmatobacter sp.]
MKKVGDNTHPRGTSNDSYCIDQFKELWRSIANSLFEGTRI